MRRFGRSAPTAAAAVAFGALIAGPVHAAVPQEAASPLTWRGDIRFRLESDWDSRRSSGSERDDRDRFRIRARVGVTYAASSTVVMGARVRSGSRASQQSPHITIDDFDGNPTGDRHALLDQWYAKISGENFSAWGGRNSFPFWKQNEFFWDDDVTPAGAMGSYRTRWPGWEFTVNAGYFALPDGGVGFNGRMVAAQAVAATSAGPVDFTGAIGVFSLDGSPGAAHLRRGNGARDYTIWVGSVQARWQAAGRPVTLGLDVMHNSEVYSPQDPDPVTAANYDQDNGFVVFAQVGSLSDKGNWLLGYYYAHIEALAVNASYAQDDWVRWGSATQTDSSDFKGHELRIGYALRSKSNLVARLYLVDAITSVQDGKRFRLDFNHTF